MRPINVFIDTSFLPQGLNRLSDEIERLVELVEANVVEVHTSEMALREWESHRVGEFVELVQNVSKAIKDLQRNRISEKLGNAKEIQKLADAKTRMCQDAEKAVKRKVKDFLRSHRPKSWVVHPIRFAGNKRRPHSVTFP